MAPVKRSLALFCILALAVMACSVTVDLGTPPLSGHANASTMVAQTLQALTEAALSATPANTPLPTATATPANTPVPPTLSVSATTDCYAGPSSNYGFVITIRSGTSVTVVGMDTADNYWIIDTPGYPGTLCWLSGQYAKVSGDTSKLPSPATPQASMYTLSEPRGLRVSCASDSSSDHHESEWTVDFRWANTDPDQTGVGVYRNGWRVATLGRGARSYTDTFRHHDRHDEVTYGVQAFSSTGVSSIVTIDVRHCEWHKDEADLITISGAPRSLFKLLHSSRSKALRTSSDISHAVGGNGAAGASSLFLTRPAQQIQSVRILALRLWSALFATSRRRCPTAASMSPAGANSPPTYSLAASSKAHRHPFSSKHHIPSASMWSDDQILT